MAKDKKQNEAVKADEVKDQVTEDEVAVDQSETVKSAAADKVPAETDKDVAEGEQEVEDEVVAEVDTDEAEPVDEGEKEADEEVVSEVDADDAEPSDEEVVTEVDTYEVELADDEADEQSVDAVKETDQEVVTEVQADDAEKADEVADEQSADDDEADADKKVSASDETKPAADNKASDDKQVPKDSPAAKQSKVAKANDQPVTPPSVAKAVEKSNEDNGKTNVKLSALGSTWRNRLIGTAAVSVLIGLGVGFGLAHLGQPTGTAVRTAYGNISSASVYNRVKHSQETVMNVQSMIMEKALEHDFPKAATDKKVNARFNKIKHNKMIYYQELQQMGTDEAIKNNIRDSLLLEAAVAKNSKVTDAQVRAAYRDYRPGMTLAYVQVDNASRASEVREQLSKTTNYKDFTEQVTDLHNQDSKHVSAGHLLPQFSSLSDSQDVPSVIKKAAMKLHKGEVSPVVKINKKTYVILYMKSDVKKSSYAEDKQDIKKTLQRQEQTNSANRQKVMLKYAKQAHPKAVDASYKDLVKDMNQAAKQAE